MQTGGPFLVGGWAASLLLERKRQFESERGQILMLPPIYNPISEVCV
jgi:hypothetical protein